MMLSGVEDRHSPHTWKLVLTRNGAHAGGGKRQPEGGRPKLVDPTGGRGSGSRLFIFPGKEESQSRA